MSLYDLVIVALLPTEPPHPLHSTFTIKKSDVSVHYCDARDGLVENVSDGETWRTVNPPIPPAPTPSETTGKSAAEDKVYLSTVIRDYLLQADVHSFVCEG